jgi:acyl carrier protein
LLRRIEKAFGSVFGRKVPFHAALSRTDEARWTSLKHVEFVIALEREFDQRFDGADATDMTSIQAVLERIRHRCP